MADAGIAGKARFDIVRYAQLWEDADVLVEALQGPPGRSLLSVCSAGDNALALLLLDPKKVVACDLSEAQLHCLRIRIAAIREFDWPDFIELMDSRPSRRRRDLMLRLMPALDTEAAEFWARRLDEIERAGLAGIGKFERYFSIFRRFVLPLIHGRKTVEGVFIPRIREDRERFFESRWDTWRWRVATDLFFCRFVMGRLGRDPSFFAHAEGSLSAQVRRKVRHAAVEMDPHANPYMQWILLGRHEHALPLAWRREHFETIRSRVDRIEIRLGPVDDPALGMFDGFNLSDVFEYMSPDEFEFSYGRLLGMARPQARLVYWNMMVPRRAPKAHTSSVRSVKELEDRLKGNDKAFFYSDFIIEESA